MAPAIRPLVVLQVTLVPSLTKIVNAVPQGQWINSEIVVQQKPVVWRMKTRKIALVRRVIRQTIG